MNLKCLRDFLVVSTYRHLKKFPILKTDVLTNCIKLKEHMLLSIRSLDTRKVLKLEISWQKNSLIQRSRSSRIKQMNLNMQYQSLKI